MDFGNLDDLLARTHGTLSSVDPDDRPLAILTGAGLSAGAVPGVVHVVQQVRKSMTAGDEVADFDAHMATVDGESQRYQAMFSYLALRKPPGFRDRIIQLSTLQAYKGTVDTDRPLAPENLQRYEADVDHWKMPVGVESLGRIWCGTSPTKRGPIVTTNFDPLCELAISKAGRDPYTRILDADGSFLREVDAQEIPQVIHVHGYWRNSATLSMTAQLAQERPALSASLRQLLARYTLLVVGYGAWNDVVTRQLVDIIRSQDGHSLDVLWCNYDAADKVRASLSENSVMQRLATAPGNVQFYSGIDVNEFFPRLERSLESQLLFDDGPRINDGRGTLVGWRPVVRTVGQDEESARNAALTFFDGRLPNWHDASSPYIPQRDIVSTVSNQIATARPLHSSSLTLITGPSGEGKTTALMHISSRLSQSNADFVVMFADDGALATVENIAALPRATPHYLFIDDAYRCVDRLKTLVAQLNEQGRSGIHIVAASRDSDWINAGGRAFMWSNHIKYNAHTLKGLNRPDAVAIINAWEKIGPDALRALESASTTEARIEALMNAASDPASMANGGAMLGAMLSTRYGKDLAGHVSQLIQRLRDRPISIYGSPQSHTRSLADAFFMIALPHSIDIPGPSPALLARCLDVPVHELHSAVLMPLGDEAAVSYTRDEVTTRHGMIARAALANAREVPGVVEKIISETVAAAVQTIEIDGFSQGLREFAYMANALPTSDEKVAAATTALETSPSRLSYRSTLSRVLRECGRTTAAVEVCADVPALSATLDAATGTRPFLNEWGVAHGNLGNWHCNILLSGLSLSDSITHTAVSAAQAGPGISCLIHALRMAVEKTNGDFAYLKGLAGLLAISADITTRNAQARWRDDAERTLGTYSLSPTDNLSVAQRELVHACAKARSSLEAPLPHGLAQRQLSFQTLATPGRIR